MKKKDGYVYTYKNGELIGVFDSFVEENDFIYKIERSLHREGFEEEDEIMMEDRSRTIYRHCYNGNRVILESRW